MQISSSVDTTDPEVEVQGSTTEFVALGSELVEGRPQICIPSVETTNSYFPIAFKSLKCIKDLNLLPLRRIQMHVMGQSLIVMGDTQAFQNLGQSLINVFSNATSGVHLHLEYSGNDQLVGPSTCSVVFVCTEIPGR